MKVKLKEKKESKSRKLDKAQLSRKERVDAITQILSGVHYDTQKDKENAIFSFINSTLSLGEIESVVAPLRPNNLLKIKNDFSNRGRAGVY